MPSGGGRVFPLEERAGLPCFLVITLPGLEGQDRGAYKSSTGRLTPQDGLLGSHRDLPDISLWPFCKTEPWGRSVSCWGWVGEVS